MFRWLVLHRCSQCTLCAQRVRVDCLSVKLQVLLSSTALHAYVRNLAALPPTLRMRRLGFYERMQVHDHEMGALDDVQAKILCALMATKLFRNFAIAI